MLSAANHTKIQLPPLLHLHSPQVAAIAGHYLFLHHFRPWRSAPQRYMGSPGNSDRGRRMGPATNINENNGVQGPLSVKSTVLPIIKAWVSRQWSGSSKGALAQHEPRHHQHLTCCCKTKPDIHALLRMHWHIGYYDSILKLFFTWFALRHVSVILYTPLPINVPDSLEYFAEARVTFNNTDMATHQLGEFPC